MNKQERLDSIYLRMALIWSENSYCIRRQVGCLIVKDNAIISDGYNGTPSGFPNIGEYPINYAFKELDKRFGDARTDSDRRAQLRLLQNAEGKDAIKTYPYVLHAEANAISKLAKSTNSSTGATLYCTDEPCMECSKLIIQAGIKRVVYLNEYRTHEGSDLLIKAGVEVTVGKL